ncbi:MAG: DUF4405 domain-containing protein [Methanoregulaceae archaeon]
MKRIAINALADIGCLVTFVLSFLTGLVLYIFLPSGEGRGGSWVTWMGATRHDWILWHDIVSFAFVALVILHLLLHWKFFRNIRTILRPWEKETCDSSE